MTTVRDHYKQECNPYVPEGDIGFFCGCEFEIEDIKSWGKLENFSAFSIEVDNSLRNNGREFITRPGTFKQALEHFDLLHTHLKLGENPFTERTSIHVHVNVKELSLIQLRQFILTYALLEPLYFDFVGDKRKNSIFCVPLNYTYLPSLYKESATRLHEKWHKYTAFNIAPVGPHKDSKALGTVEFRHLYGTNNRDVFEVWLQAIKQLYEFIANQPEFDIIKAIEEEDVGVLAQKIVPVLVKKPLPIIRAMLEDSLIDVKLSVGGLTK